MIRTTNLLTIILVYCVIYSASAQKPTRVYVNDIQKKIFAPIIEFSGTVEYPELSHVSTEIAGIVDKVFFDEGNAVKKNQILVQLNTDILEKEIEIAKAIHKVNIEEMNLNKWEYERYDTLYSSGDVPLRDLKQREAEYLKSKYHAEKAASEISLLEAMFEKKKIRSPFNGVIVEKLTHTGNWLEASMAAAIVAAGDEADIICNVPQSVSHKISKGDPAEIILKNGKLSAKVFSVIPYGDINTRTFPVKIRVKNNSKLTAGMEVKVKLQTSKPREAYIIPRDAILMKNDCYVIYIAENSKAREIPVEIISYEGVNAEVQSSFLSDKMQVIIRGNQYLSNEQPIEIVK